MCLSYESTMHFMHDTLTEGFTHLIGVNLLVLNLEVSIIN